MNKFQSEKSIPFHINLHQKLRTVFTLFRFHRIYCFSKEIELVNLSKYCWHGCWWIKSGVKVLYHETNIDRSCRRPTNHLDRARVSMIKNRLQLKTLKANNLQFSELHSLFYLDLFIVSRIFFSGEAQIYAICNFCSLFLFCDRKKIFVKNYEAKIVYRFIRALF